MKHTKQMYVVVNENREPIIRTLSYSPYISQSLHTENPDLWKHYIDKGYTVQPVTVTIELP